MLRRPPTLLTLKDNDVQFVSIYKQAYQEKVNPLELLRKKMEEAKKQEETSISPLSSHEELAVKRREMTTAQRIGL
ncbi:hypothetical protein K493DRAFT_311798 [Basidiobolus meristosporus CBS 931.73]|uniref:Uncharacterized protein n=1 Tax=Basidiobolus meristosporus CBS 931.73 TaxID=1314790 RepID=A0A1Y1YZQ4_9FUNG|nr:hypothetical protein K493DRAFT_311798 [Basidiobolus meristosporus CBS 931.73]|eukprot:ORY03177.1 hypothetical protein K493DRAFT_311798 [Basidiobolus meristosporus CBS 931.73]